MNVSSRESSESKSLIIESCEGWMRFDVELFIMKAAGEGLPLLKGQQSCRLGGVEFLMPLN